MLSWLILLPSLLCMFIYTAIVIARSITCVYLCLGPISMLCVLVCDTACTAHAHGAAHTYTHAHNKPTKQLQPDQNKRTGGVCIIRAQARKTPAHECKLRKPNIPYQTYRGKQNVRKTQTKLEPRNQTSMNTGRHRKKHTHTPKPNHWTKTQFSIKPRIRSTRAGQNTIYCA